MATQRLRRQLENVDDRVLASVSESFCFFGTPLPALDSRKRDVNELKPLWEQEVRDEQGRRRFHGAFTGGWSAGYYNTVGSKDGWTPSTFKSSRSDKAKGKQQGDARQAKPEDFMDEEDLEEMRQARELANKDGYGMGSEAPVDPMMALFGGEAEGGVPDIRPASTSIGTQLLQKMGWRPGQGIGPRITAARRRLMLLKSGASKAELDEEEHEEEASKHLFAPPDTRLMAADMGKSDLKGLGHSGTSSLRMGGLEEALRRAREEQSSAAREDRGGGFGISVLETDSDGEDEMYAPMSDIRQSTLGRGGRASRWNAGASREADAAQPSQGLASQDENKWRDGKPCLPGFKVASKVLDQDVWFKAPPIPPGWKPDPTRVWAAEAAARGGPPPPLHAPPPRPLAGTSAHNLRPDDRASILGEARMPGPPPSILNYLSAKDRERLERARDGGAAPAPGPPPPPPPSQVPIEIPPTDRMTALAALRGFMPFGNDPSKQERYRAYLQSQANPSDAPPQIKPAAYQTVEQLNHELCEFAKSANIFRPMSTAMASRFQSASSSAAAGEIAQPAPGLWRPEPKPKAEDTKADGGAQGSDDNDEEPSPAQQAARAGMFGTMTRKTTEWYPERLLCKRFNIPMPHPEKVREKQQQEGEKDEPTKAKGGGNETPRANAKWEASKRQIEQLASSRAWEGAADGQVDAWDRTAQVQSAQDPKESSSAAPPPAKRAGEPASLATVGLGEDEAQGADTLTYVKPPLDIFKAVFASDDEDEEDEVELEAESTAATAARAADSLSTAPTSSNGPNAKPSPSSMAAPPPPPAGPDASDPTSAFRPTFIPRSKRRAADEVSDGESAPATSSSSAPRDGSAKTKKKKKDGSSKSGKDAKRPKGMLTFDLDEEEEGEGFKKGKKTVNEKREREDVHASASHNLGAKRARASDLF